MPPVFGHGRLRLYLLKLLSESPRHGYEVIRLLEERFNGLYAPSAGTVYPRLAKLEAEGLIRHTTEGGRKVYSLTPEGRAELAAREAELAQLEGEIRDSLAALAAGIREDIGGSARDLREEIRRATAAARKGTAAGPRERGRDGADDPHTAGAAAGAAFEEAARRMQERFTSRAASGDWQRALREGLDGIGQGIGGWGRTGRPATPWTTGWSHPADEPGGDDEPVADPERELARLLDRFRDDVRDAARDHGMTQELLREARRQLSASAAHLIALLTLPRD
ncbi:PadR family transcriptional regulator [Streptomyces sp. RFCAC02]|uniref:PadR family transcriptional regulator n=1 Tax=Streptomyces sp. RFCAC02 TaxID=2499143 RepID=UPI0010203FE3|nr:PadR family transcriptional regulator [Streptomyces sp. RFCAC02]